MKPFIKPIAWAFGLTLLLLTLGLYGIDRPPRRTHAGQVVVPDTTRPFPTESAGVGQPGSTSKESLTF